ncbi:hypothetical protein [Pontiella sp.]|uniref:hypothetical protein n=1 Tax=Pontiella sp. TaxID=2837462 RepID=UPI00356AB0E3
MPTCPKNIIVTPNNNPADRVEVNVSLPDDDKVKVEIRCQLYERSCWVVRFKKRKNNPPSIRGNVLTKKIMFDAVLSKVDRLGTIPGLWKEINAAIAEGLRDVVEVGPERKLSGLLELELPLEKAKSSYIYIDSPGMTRDGPGYYLIDLPLFIGRLLGNN